MKQIQVLLFCLLFSASSFCQQGSDKTGLATKENIIKQLKRVTRIKHDNRDSAFNELKKVKKLIKELGSDSLMIKAFFIEADAFALDGNFEYAITLLDSASRKASKFYEEEYRGSYLFNKARYLDYANKKDSALVYLFEYRDLKKGEWPTPSIKIGEIYANLGDRKRAEIYLEEALQINREHKEPQNYLYNIYTVLQHYKQWEDYEKIAELETEYLNYKIEKKGNVEAIFSINSHTSADLPNSDFKKMEQEILKLLPIYKKNSNEFIYIHSVYTLSKQYLKNNQHYKAYPLLLEAIDLAEDFGYKDLQLNLEQLAYESSRALGKTDEAISHLENAFSLKDSIRAQKIRINAQDLATKYETEKTQQDLVLLQAKDEIKSFRLKLFIVASGILLFLLAGLLYYYLGNKAKSKELASKNDFISKALKEKEVLLREIHHRVKNNLQVISSLLNLQSNYISDDVALRAINDGKNRVNSMALIHQKLYQEKNLTGINAQDYFSDLVESLCDTYNISENEINIQVNVKPIFLDVDTMVPLGLITNELVSNALKHAFKFDNSENNKIRISLNEENGSLVLRVADNGKGIDKETFLNSKSFGNKLIQAFLPKLNAILNIEKDHGTEFEFIVKKYEIAA